MPRIHVEVPPELHDRVKALCGLRLMNISKFIRRGMELAIIDLGGAFSEAANDAKSGDAPIAVGERVELPPAAAAPGSGAVVTMFPKHSVTPSAGNVSAENSDLVHCIKRGDAAWFDCEAVCGFLGVTTIALFGEIDPEDDTLHYANKLWIDERGVNEARALSRDTAKADEMGAWLRSKT